MSDRAGLLTPIAFEFANPLPGSYLIGVARRSSPREIFAHRWIEVAEAQEVDATVELPSLAEEDLVRGTVVGSDGTPLEKQVRLKFDRTRNGRSVSRNSQHSIAFVDGAWWAALGVSFWEDFVAVSERITVEIASPEYIKEIVDLGDSREFHVQLVKAAFAELRGPTAPPDSGLTVGLRPLVSDGSETWRFVRSIDRPGRIGPMRPGEYDLVVSGLGGEISKRRVTLRAGENSFDYELPSPGRLVLDVPTGGSYRAIAAGSPARFLGLNGSRSTSTGPVTWDDLPSGRYRITRLDGRTAEVMFVEAPSSSPIPWVGRAIDCYVVRAKEPANLEPHRLEAEDRITGIDGVEFENLKAMRDAVQKAKSAAIVTVTVERRGRALDLEYKGADFKSLVEDREIALVLMSREL